MAPGSRKARRRAITGVLKKIGSSGRLRSCNLALSTGVRTCRRGGIRDGSKPSGAV